MVTEKGKGIALTSTLNSSFISQRLFSKRRHQMKAYTRFNTTFL